MTDYTRSGLNNQKRKASYVVARPTEAEILSAGNAIVANLPERSVVLNAYVIVHTASSTASSTLDIKVGATVVANEVPVPATGVKEGVSFVPLYFATGGAVTIAPGAVAPAAGDLDAELVLEYVELDQVTGEYTN